MSRAVSTQTKATWKLRMYSAHVNNIYFIEGRKKLFVMFMIHESMISQEHEDHLAGHEVLP